MSAKSEQVSLYIQETEIERGRDCIMIDVNEHMIKIFNHAIEKSYWQTWEMQ